jgi:hypothetical protein
MTNQGRKYRGYKTQAVVADYLSQWWPFAQSAGAGRTGSDVVNTPFDIEVKARTGFNPSAALKQLKNRENGKLGFAVLRLNGQGEKAEDYAVIIRLADLMELIWKCTKCGHLRYDLDDCKTCELLESRKS